MAIARVAYGTRTKVDTSAGGGYTLNVALPTGHLSGHLLFLFTTTDDNSNATADPSGWTRLYSITNGTSMSGPYTPRVRSNCYYRIDTGSLGSTVSVTFNSAAWPTGNPSVIAFTAAYSGCDTTNPIERWNFFSTVSTAAAQAHPQETTVTANAWLLTFRAISSDAPGATFTNSVVGDTENQDDFDTIPELACATYDSNAALTAGLQTQRTTTASRLATYGGVAASIVIRPAPVANAAVALPDVASATGTAFNPSVSIVNGPWDACGPGGMPVYSTVVDWAGNGFGTLSGSVLTANAYVGSDTSNWVASNATIARAKDPLSTAWCLQVVPNGVSASGGVNYSPRTAVGSITPGRTYTAQCWVYSPAGWTDLNTVVDWYDASDAYISTGGITPVSVPAGVWTLLRQNLVAPALASRSAVRFRFGGTPPSSNVSYVYGLMLADPAATGSYSFPDPGDDITDDDLSDGITITYGRDQSRQLSPGAAGSMSLRVNNSSRKYSPENAASALYGSLDPARNAQAKVTFAGSTTYLFTGRIDDFDVKVSRGDRSVSFSFLDSLALLQGIKLSTPLYQTIRTGEAVNAVLDAAGWTGPRDIDYGATVIPFWWVEGTDAFSALQDLVKSEGPPAIAYQAPDGTFVFRDRHHRLLRAQSVQSQAQWAAARMGDCASPAATGLHFTDDDFVYSNGWKDIVNSVSFDVGIRQPQLGLSAVWSSTDPISLANGESRVIGVTGSDPFMNAVVPDVSQDFTLSGAGTLLVGLDRDSGASANITITAVGGAVQVLSMQLRAQAVPVVNTVKVMLQDGVSIGEHGEKTYPDEVPWAGVNDAYALATLILQHYSERLPTIQLRVPSENPQHWQQVVGRTVGDRISVRFDEMGMNTDFFVESVTHTITRIWTDRPPVHAVVLGCEKCPDAAPANPFTFDKRGAGFDQGVFDPVASDDPDTIWIWDDPVQGTFDGGLFAT